MATSFSKAKQNLPHVKNTFCECHWINLPEMVYKKYAKNNPQAHTETTISSYICIPGAYSTGGHSVSGESALLEGKSGQPGFVTVCGWDKSG